MTSKIDTNKTANHRRLRFESIDDVLAEIDRVVQADAESRLRTLGNWTPGQIMAHIAAWIEYGYSDRRLWRLHHTAPLFLWKVISSGVVRIRLNCRRRHGYELVVDDDFRRNRGKPQARDI